MDVNSNVFRVLCILYYKNKLLFLLLYSSSSKLGLMLKNIQSTLLQNQLKLHLA